MARIDNLNNFLTDVAASIKEKKGTDTPIPAANFDTEIRSIEIGGMEIKDCAYLTSPYQLDTISEEYTSAVILNDDNSVKTIAIKTPNGIEDIRKHTYTNEFGIYRHTGQNTFNYCNIFSKDGMYKYYITVNTTDIFCCRTQPNSSYPSGSTVSIGKLADLGITLHSSSGYTYAIASACDIEKPYIALFDVSPEYSTSAKLVLIGYREVDNMLELDGRIYQTDISSSGYFSRNTCFAISDNGKYLAYSTDRINTSGGRNTYGYNAIFTVNDDLSVVRSTELNSGRQKRVIYFADNDRVLLQYSPNTDYSGYDSCYYRFTDDMSKTGKLKSNIAILNDGKHGISATQYATSVTLSNIIIDYEKHTISNGTNIQTLSTGLEAGSNASYGCIACLGNFDRFLYIDASFSKGTVGIDIDISKDMPMSIHTDGTYTDKLDNGRNIVFPYRAGFNPNWSAIYGPYTTWNHVLYNIAGTILELPLTEQSTTSNLLSNLEIELPTGDTGFWPIRQNVTITGDLSADKIVRKDVRYKITIPQSTLANAIGLTADKIKAGETILGVKGTMEAGTISQDEYNQALTTANEIKGGNV